MKKFSKFLAVIVFAFVAVGSSLLTISCANNAGGGGSGSESSTGEIAIGTESTGGGVVAPSPSILDTIETKYTVVLDNFDAAKKIPVIKAVREVTGLGLGESKSLVENAPKVVKEGVDKDAAEEFVTKITLAGGYVTKKPTYSVTAENVAEVIRAMTQSGSVEVAGSITDSTLVEIEGALSDLYGNRPNVLVGVDLRRTYGVDTFADDEFYGCDNLESIGIPASVTNLFGESRNPIHTYNPNAIFYKKPIFFCQNLANISVDEENNVYTSDEGVLYTKDKKTLVRYPPKKRITSFMIPLVVTSITDSAFSGAVNLLSINLSENINKIGGNAFGGCNGITAILIPHDVKEIGERVFNGCSNLSSVVYDGCIEEWKTINNFKSSISTSFTGCSVTFIHCTDGDVDRPKTFIEILEG